MANPVKQFVIEPIHAEPLIVGGLDISYTNSALWMTIALFVSVAFLTLATKRKALVPNRAQMTAELLYGFIANMVRTTIGSKGAQYFPFIFTLFLFVLLGNLLGLIPGSFTYTSHLAVTGFMAFFIFVMVIAFGFFNHGLKFLTLFKPPGVPWWLIVPLVAIEIVSFFVRPITLAVRLFANMMAGHIMLKIIAGFAVAAAGMGGGYVILGIFPIFFNILMIAFEFLVAGIQAYVFAILTCVYLKDTVDLHH
ncbi:MAG: F0F1 ATP synthase subunit A [Pseudomonadota bacterium]